MRMEILGSGLMGGKLGISSRGLDRARAPGLHGTRIRSVRLSSSLRAAAGFIAKVGPSRRSAPVMWSGSRPARSTGMGPH